MYVMPWLLKKFIEKQRKKFYDENHSRKNSTKRKSDEGDEVNVHAKHKKQITSDDIGEYVNFKEIKDNDSSKLKKDK